MKKITLSFLAIFCFLGIGLAAIIPDYTVSVTDIQYEYQPLGDRPQALRQVKKVRLYSANPPAWQREVDLKGGQRIEDEILGDFLGQGSFLFHKDDRGLVKIFESIADSNSQFDKNSRLVKSRVTGIAIWPVRGAAELERKNFKYDIYGRIRAFETLLQVSGTDFRYLNVLFIDYDGQGKVKSFTYEYGQSGYATKYFIYNIKYDLSGEVGACTVRTLR